MRELILGGQRSGKSRCAEARAAAWLATPAHSAVLLATALAGDEEMRVRIARHRADRVAVHPLLATIEVPHDLPAALRHESAPNRLVIVDCLSLWTTNLLMPLQGDPLDDAAWGAAQAGLVQAIAAARGPLVFVSNEIGLGITPLGAAARRYVDDLGRLHQAVAATCEHVTWMVAGIEVAVKRGHAESLR